MSTWVLGGAVALFALSSVLVLLALPVPLMTSQDIPADVVDALYPATLSLEDGSGLLNISFSSRGVQKLTTFEEPDLDWIYQGAYSGWDYTEWHWWKGHPFDFQARGHENLAYWESFRPRFWGKPKVHAERLREGYLRIDFETDGFRFSQDYLLPGRAQSDVAYWDMVFTAANSTGREIEEYGHFFACYTSVNGERSYWFWDAGGDLVLWEDREAGHLNGYVTSSDAYFQSSGNIPHCPRGKGRIIGTWHHPVLVSHASPEGWRSVILLDPDTTGAVACGMRGVAMDFIFYPGHKERVFQKGGSFRSHLRHLMVKSPGLPSRQQLEGWWRRFQESRSDVRQRIGRFRDGAAKGGQRPEK